MKHSTQLLMKNSLALVLFVLLSSSSSVFAQKFKEVKEIPEGKALVYIYRPGSMLGAAVHYTVNANDEKVSEAHLRNKTYLVYFAEPARYTFWAQVSGNRMQADVDVEAGNTYYIEGSCCKLLLSNEKKANSELKKLKLSKHD